MKGRTPTKMKGLNVPEIAKCGPRCWDGSVDSVVDLRSHRCWHRASASWHVRQLVLWGRACADDVIAGSFGIVGYQIAVLRCFAVC